MEILDLEQESISNDELFGDEEEILDDASKESLDVLIKKLITFTEVFCSENERKPFSFYPYQVPIAYSIIESMIIGGAASGEKTLIATRQSGKSEILANCVAAMMAVLPTLADIYPTWLGKFRGGFQVGVFAPTEEQADTVFSRIVSKLTSDTATEVLLHELDDRTGSQGSRGKGKVITLVKSGSLCRMQTCNPQAKIESKTYHFVIVDEAQEADKRMIKKSIDPMLASTNGTMWLSGTARAQKCYFYEAIQRNKRMDANGGRGHKRRHWEYDWRVAAKYNSNYKAFIKKTITEIGEDSEEFRLSYCGVSGNKLLSSDLRWVDVSDVAVGDRLLGFDEHGSDKGSHRRMRHASVEDVGTLELPCSTISLDDGSEMTFSNDHQWLVQTAGRRTLWKRTADLTAGDRIWRVADVWQPLNESYEVGYLRAAFDGEGCLVTSRGELTGLSFSQRDNAMLAEVKRCLDHYGYEYGEYNYTHSGANGDVYQLHILGGRKEAMRFLAEVRPLRLLDSFANLEGSIGGIGKSRSGGTEHPKVVSVADVGVHTVYAIRTSTSTYVANGLASHNCNEWLLDRGMFVTEERLNSLYDPSMMRVKQYWRTPIVVGIDVARSNDSTVVTPVWVDWDHPNPFGLYEHRVLDWLEINNVEWESQYAEIINYLKNYDVLRIAVDAQGVGGAVAERLDIMTPSSVEVISMSSDMKAQNERWTHLTQLIQRRQLIVPGHSKARRTKSWKKFHQQMVDLERVYKGSNMLAQAPDEKGAFDDYADSLALACACTTMETMPTVEVYDNFLLR